MYSIELNMSKCTLVYGDCKIVQYCAVMLYTTIDTVKGFGMWVGQGEISKFMAY